MKKILMIIDRITDVSCITLMSIAFLITFFHIIGRYILRAPIFFSEELARYCFMWACMLGAAIVNRNDEHTNVSYFISLIPTIAQNILYIIRELFILIVLTALIVQGIKLAFTMRTVQTAALGLSWAIVYAMLPVGSFLVGLSTVELIISKICEITSQRRG